VARLYFRKRPSRRCASAVPDDGRHMPAMTATAIVLGSLYCLSKILYFSLASRDIRKQLPVK
jgi:hypothetical protein